MFRADAWIGGTLGEEDAVAVAVAEGVPSQTAPAEARTDEKLPHHLICYWVLRSNIVDDHFSFKAKSAVSRVQKFSLNLDTISSEAF